MTAWEGAYWLSAAALVPWSTLVFPDPSLTGGAGRLIWLPLVWGALLVVTGGPAAQVTYTALAAGGIAVGEAADACHQLAGIERLREHPVRHDSEHRVVLLLP